jgi:hypothetical protein
MRAALLDAAVRLGDLVPLAHGLVQRADGGDESRPARRH